jgi:prepilin-type N-terminal cleavage/methylation domain-containing protein
MHRVVPTKTAGYSLIELMVVMAVIASLAATAVPAFITYRDRSRIAQAIGSSETIRAALASYAAGSPENIYPQTNEITDFSSLSRLVNANGGTLPLNGVFSVNHYNLYDSNGDGIADTYSMRLIVNGVANVMTGAQLLITPQGILKCTANGNPC